MCFCSLSQLIPQKFFFYRKFLHTDLVCQKRHFFTFFYLRKKSSLALQKRGDLVYNTSCCTKNPFFHYALQKIIQGQAIKVNSPYEFNFLDHHYCPLKQQIICKVMIYSFHSRSYWSCVHNTCYNIIHREKLFFHRL